VRRRAFFIAREGGGRAKAGPGEKNIPNGG
jgi:hypothetical protein